VIQKNEKGHDFESDTGICTRCGMTIREYEDHGKPPCRGNNGERSDAFPGALNDGISSPHD
jgi:hypothetical protein